MIYVFPIRDEFSPNISPNSMIVRFSFQLQEYHIIQLNTNISNISYVFTISLIYKLFTKITIRERKVHHDNQILNDYHKMITQFTKQGSLICELTFYAVILFHYFILLIRELCFPFFHIFPEFYNIKEDFFIKLVEMMKSVLMS